MHRFTFCNLLANEIGLHAAIIYDYIKYLGDDLDIYEIRQLNMNATHFIKLFSFMKSYEVEEYLIILLKNHLIEKDFMNDSIFYMPTGGRKKKNPENLPLSDISHSLNLIIDKL